MALCYPSGTQQQWDDCYDDILEEAPNCEGFVRKRLRGLGVPARSLDDATQDVFEVLVRRIGDYDPERPLVPWMAGVARKVAKRHREWEQRRAPPPLPEPPSDLPLHLD